MAESTFLVVRYTIAGRSPMGHGLMYFAGRTPSGYGSAWSAECEHATEMTEDQAKAYVARQPLNGYEFCGVIEAEPPDPSRFASISGG